MTIYNAKNYKLAKVFTKDLETIIKETENSIASLTPYTRYRPVNRILLVLKNELSVLKSHQTECKKIITVKGQVRPEEI